MYIHCNYKIIKFVKNKNNVNKGTSRKRSCACVCIYCVYIYIFCNERKNGLSRIQRCKSRMQFFSFEILFSRKLSLNVFSQKLGMQNTHPDEFFKFDFPGHEISSENNFIRTFFAYFSHGGIETSFSVPLAANIFFFFLFNSIDQIFLYRTRSIILTYSRKIPPRKFARSTSIFPTKRLLIGKLDIMPESRPIDFLLDAII